MSLAAGSGPMAARRAHLKAVLDAGRERLDVPALTVEGKLTRMVGLTLEAVGCEAPIGARCEIIGHDGRHIDAEVVGFSDDRVLLMPVGDTMGLSPNARVVPVASRGQIGVGIGLLGRVLDGSGRPIDGRGPVETEASVALHSTPVNPLERAPVRESLDVGVRAINALLRVGRGQRLGLFAGSGVGKSSLLAMMTRHTAADVIVLGLIGERGREVHEFVHETLGEHALERAVVVATPADNSPLLRAQGALLATAIAEHFRAVGCHVLLLMDSLTRFAQAQREIGLAVGEPPTTKGYPPSVFARMPQLVERAGNASGPGTMTAIYTVLTEGDDNNDPIADSARAILDGHIVLSRGLAESGHYPAIDIESSVSRVMNMIASRNELALAQRFREINARYNENRDLIALGVYQRGSDPRIDEAIAYRESMRAFLCQDVDEQVSVETSIEALAHLFSVNLPPQGDSARATRPAPSPGAG